MGGNAGGVSAGFSAASTTLSGFWNMAKSEAGRGKAGHGAEDDGLGDDSPVATEGVSGGMFEVGGDVVVVETPSGGGGGSEDDADTPGAETIGRRKDEGASAAVQEAEEATQLKEKAAATVRNACCGYNLNLEL